MTERNDSRVPLRCPAWVEHDGIVLAAQSANVSGGGVFVEAITQLPLGSHVTVSLEFPQGLLQVPGEVRWVRSDEQSPVEPAGTGIRFTELTAEDRDALNGVLDAQRE
jgi:uncharacterized protein (TIGR02266 family)